MLVTFSFSSVPLGGREVYPFGEMQYYPCKECGAFPISSRSDTTEWLSQRPPYHQLTQCVEKVIAVAGQEAEHPSAISYLCYHLELSHQQSR